ncbi:unnamed protein product, partial [Brassica rapa]
LFRITKRDKKVHPETPKSILSTFTLSTLLYEDLCTVLFVLYLGQTVLRKFI